MKHESINDEVARKVGYSFTPAVLFFLVSLPLVYGYTNDLGSKVGDNYPSYGFSTYDGMCPSSVGKFLHAFVFFALVWVVMRRSEKLSHKSNALLAKYAFYSTLLFFALSSSDAYNMTNGLVSGMSNGMGCPTAKGAFVHGLVFLVALTLMMFFPKDE